MTFTPSPLRAVLFDWAGTLIDHGSTAPARAFVEVFARHQVSLSLEEARGPMGLPKREHIATLLRLPAIAERWRTAHGRPASDQDLDDLYRDYEPLNASLVVEHATLIPGAKDLEAWLRDREIAIGTTTGYPRAILAPALEAVAAQGFRPDAVVCADEVSEGRPSPLALYRCLTALGVWPAARTVKIDDTTPGIFEGRYAGCWTIGLTLSGNGAALSAEALAAMDTAERAQLHERLAQDFIDAGADYVAETIADVRALLETIEARIAAGETPEPLLD